MDKNRIVVIKNRFDENIHFIEGTEIEYWLARELMELLVYERWENFENAIERAIESCKTSGVEVPNHFRETTKLI